MAPLHKRNVGGESARQQVRQQAIYWPEKRLGKNLGIRIGKSHQISQVPGI